MPQGLISEDVRSNDNPQTKPNPDKSTCCQLSTTFASSASEKY